MSLLLTRPFDEDIHTFDEAAAWARLFERGLRELRYRQREEADGFSEIGLADSLAPVIPLDPWSRKVDA